MSLFRTSNQRKRSLYWSQYCKVWFLNWWRKTILGRGALQKSYEILHFEGSWFAFSYIRWIIQICHFKQDQMDINQASAHGKRIQFQSSLSGINLLQSKPSISSTVSSIIFVQFSMILLLMQSFDWKCTICDMFICD